jgi:hypothetical protein BBPR_0959
VSNSEPFNAQPNAQQWQPQTQDQQSQTQLQQPIQQWQGDQQQSQAPAPYQQPGTLTHPVTNLDTSRSLLKFILLGIITFGIYSVWVVARSGEDLNLIASRWDNKRTMSYWLIAFVLGPLTGGIAWLVWMHIVCERIESEQKRREMRPDVRTEDFWLWGFLGSFIIVGPFIFWNKFLNAMNNLAADYNVNG